MLETKHILSDEARYRLLKLLEDNPGLSQRELAAALDVSLGKVNYCMRALVDRGWVRIVNFRNSRNKIGYLYRLTPTGIREKALATRRFFLRKLAEYEQLEAEIEALREEVAVIDIARSAQPE